MKRVILNPKEERRLLRGHLWVFRNEVTEMPALDDGEMAGVYTHCGRFVGQGFYQADGGIAVRLLSRKKTPLDDDFLNRRIERACQFRKILYPGETVYRWVHAESDALPGLVADRYDGVVCVETSCAFYAAMAERLAKAFLSYEGVAGVRLELGGDVRCFGSVPDTMKFTMDGLRFAIDLQTGQKTGLFLDQRTNAAAMMTYAHGARVLDGHCYVGLWSCHAVQARAASVLGVDTSAAAIENAKRNAQLNQLESRCAFECADLEEVLRRGERYELVLLDPPAFAKTRAQQSKAFRLYQALNYDGIQAVEPGGYLITSCCSHFVGEAVFLEAIKRAAASAQRQVWVLDVRGAGPDHPVLMAMPETGYLTCVTLRVW